MLLDLMGKGLDRENPKVETYTGGIISIIVMNPSHIFRVVLKSLRKNKEQNDQMRLS